MTTDEMIRLYLVELYTLQDIGDMAGLTKEAVRLRLSKVGIVSPEHIFKARSFKKKEELARQEKWFRKHVLGQSVIQIASASETYNSVISGWLKKKQLPLLNRRSYSVREAIRLYKQGKSSIEIANLMNVSYVSIINALHIHGIEVRNYNNTRANRVSREIEDQVIDLRRNHHTIKKICSVTGLGFNTVKRILGRRKNEKQRSH